MKHFASPAFWALRRKLSQDIQKLADRTFETLKKDPGHPSLHLKQVRKYWSVRVGIKYRALAIEIEDGLLWFWIGTHAQYDKLLKT